MAREIVIFKTEKAPDGTLTFRVVLWLTTPATLVGIDLTRTSAATGRPINPTTQAELDAIRAGTITEHIYTVTAPVGSTALQVKTTLDNGFTAAQAALNLIAPTKDYSGSYRDSIAGWVVV